MRLLVTLAVLTASAAGTAFGAQDSVHFVRPASRSRAPVTTELLSQRIVRAAKQYRQYAPIPRVAFYDIAFPADSAEYAAMAGNALLLVTAISQDESELPLANLWVENASGQHGLRLLTSVLSNNEGTDPSVRVTFGPHRVDALYVLPMTVYLEVGQLFLDFSRNRTGFKVADFSGDLPEMLRSLPVHTELSGEPAVEALLGMAEREYPGFVSRN